MRWSALLTFALAAQAATLLVVNKEDATLAIVDPASGKVLGTVPTGEGPHEVATDGKIAIVCNYGAQTPGSTLSIIDLSAQKELKRLQLPVQRPHGIQVLDSKAYFTAELNKVVARYDIATGALDWFMGTGQEITHMLVVNKDASAIYTANIMSDSVTALQKGDGSRPWRATHIAIGVLCVASMLPLILCLRRRAPRSAVAEAGPRADAASPAPDSFWYEALRRGFKGAGGVYGSVHRNDPMSDQAHALLRQCASRTGVNQYALVFPE